MARSKKGQPRTIYQEEEGWTGKGGLEINDGIIGGMMYKGNPTQGFLAKQTIGKD